MAKKIESYKDLSIRLRANRGVFVVDLVPIGGGEPSFKSKAKAVAHAKEMFDRYRGNKPVMAESTWAIDDAFAAFKDHLEAKVQDPDIKYGSGSQANQEAHLNFISALKFDGLQFGKARVSSLAKEFIKEQFWLELRRYGAKSGITALNRFNTFAQALEYCRKQEQVEVNVAHAADIEKPDRHARWKETTEDGAARIDSETLQKILDHVEPKHQLKVLFAANTGLRVGEQLALKVYDPKKPLEGGVDFKTNQVFVRTAVKRTRNNSDAFIGKPKSEKGIRTVAITPDLSVMLEEEYKNLPDFQKAEGWLFPSEHGTRCSGRNWRERILYRACKAAGLQRERALADMARPSPRLCDRIASKEEWGFYQVHGNDGPFVMKTTLIYKHIVHEPEYDRSKASI